MAQGVPKRRSGPSSKGERELEHGVVGCLPVLTGGTSGYQWTSTAKAHRTLNSMFPLSSKWLPGLRRVDLEWVSWTSASILAAVSVDTLFPSKRNLYACRRPGLSLVRLPRFSGLVARCLPWPCLGWGLPSAVTSPRLLLPRGWGSSAQSLFPFQGFPQSPVWLSLPKSHCLSSTLPWYFIFALLVA